MEILTINKTCIKSKNRTLFKNLFLHIKEGQNWAVVGSSGSGKTALLKAIRGDFFVSGGEVLHHYYDWYKTNHNISDPLFSHRNLVSYVDVKHDFTNLSHTRDFFYQQRYNASYANESQTVDGYLRDISSKKTLDGPWYVERVIREFNLEPLQDKHLIKLSNGETKRLRIAAALLKNPAVLLLDNPFTGLDVKMRAHFNELFKKISEEGMTLIMATSPHQIPEMITHVLVLEKDREAKPFSRSSFNSENIDMNPGMPSLPTPQELDILLYKKSSGSFDILVKMDSVHVQYGNTKVLEDINWQIKPGEHWALSGPNGSGKSTLLSLIYGDHPQAYANNIVLFDRQRGTGESIWDIKKNIGFMSPELFQYFPGSFSCLQVVESGFFDSIGLYQKVNDEQKQTALKWMKVMGIWEETDTLFSDVSATLQRLCLLARALVKNPALLILDEPCQGFDDTQQKHFKALIDAIAGHSKMAMIYVTHHREELPECFKNEKTHIELLTIKK
ncbi:ATP-binding cassette domain-containing protein [Marinilabilia sp.]|uniref:ATP-binding cassette domain-containing protein n=1 Tax=Marinilabilia sp. TaxID=2021252 RepID=UPI0025C58755|nr:ATP-binding cassette domain-containing protein [Marinilabilia sp.]